MLNSNLQKAGQRETEPPLLDEVNLLKYICGNSRTKKYLLFLSAVL